MRAGLVAGGVLILGALVGGATVTGHSGAIVGDRTGGTDQGSWVQAFTQDPQWLPIAPNTVPAGAKIAAADGIGEDRPVTIRSVTFTTDSGGTVTLCVAGEQAVAASECMGADAVKKSRYGREFFVAVMGADEPDAWLDGYADTTPAVEDLTYLD